jgi:hypothetical protein
MESLTPELSGGPMHLRTVRRQHKETPQMHKYGERKTTRMMMAIVPPSHFRFGLRKIQPMDFSATEHTNGENKITDTTKQPSHFCTGVLISP